MVFPQVRLNSEHWKQVSKTKHDRMYKCTCTGFSYFSWSGICVLAFLIFVFLGLDLLLAVIFIHLAPRDLVLLSVFSHEEAIARSFPLSECITRLEY